MADLSGTAAAIPERDATPADDVGDQIADCDRKLAQYPAALDAGADPASVARWIIETETERARLRRQARQSLPQPAMTEMRLLRS